MLGIYVGQHGRTPIYVGQHLYVLDNMSPNIYKMGPNRYKCYPTYNQVISVGQHVKFQVREDGQLFHICWVYLLGCTLYMLGDIRVVQQI